MGSVKIEHWWVGMVVAGVAIFGAGGIAKDRTVVAVGLGLLLLGIGEWMNHPRVERIEFGMGTTWKLSGFPRRASFVGTIFSFLGCILLGAGVVRVAIALFQ